jgi:hypothetical protein
MEGVFCVGMGYCLAECVLVWRYDSEWIACFLINWDIGGLSLVCRCCCVVSLQAISFMEFSEMFNR